MTFLTWNTCLRLATRLVKNPIFHRVYLRKYNDLEAEICNTGTLISLLNIIQFFPFEVAPRQVISKITKLLS